MSGHPQPGAPTLVPENPCPFCILPWLITLGYVFILVQCAAKNFPYDKVCICGYSHPNILSLRVFYLISSTRPFAIAIQIHIAAEFSKGDEGNVIGRSAGVDGFLAY